MFKQVGTSHVSQTSDSRPLSQAECLRERPKVVWRLWTCCGYFGNSNEARLQLMACNRSLGNIQAGNSSGHADVDELFWKMSQFVVLMTGASWNAAPHGNNSQLANLLRPTINPCVGTVLLIFEYSWFIYISLLGGNILINLPIVYQSFYRFMVLI